MSDLQVIAACDWVVDLGPEGGRGGGALVAAGTPEALADCDGSHTGAALRPFLSAGFRCNRSTRREPLQPVGIAVQRPTGSRFDGCPQGSRLSIPGLPGRA